MSSIDVLLLVVLLASLLLGVWRGLVFEVLSVAGWVTAFFAAQWYAAPVANGLPLGETPEPLRHAVGFVLVFVAVAFVAGFLAWLIKKGVQKIGLRPVDRTLGGAFGLLRGVVLLLAAALVVNMTPFKDNIVWQQSQGVPWLNAGLQGIKGLVPASLAQYFP
jgi:membrane protein required for colicin V production